MTRVLLVDDHPMIGSALESLLRDSEFELVGRARTASQALTFVRTLSPDIVLLDVHLPDRSGIEVLRQLRQSDGKAAVILLTAGMDDMALHAAHEQEPDGIVLKTSDPAHLIECLEKVRAGRIWVDPEVSARLTALGDRPAASGLTPRERQLVGLVKKGLRNRQIAAELGVTEGTVKVYLHAIFDKLGVASRTELAMRADSLSQ